MGAVAGPLRSRTRRTRRYKMKVAVVFLFTLVAISTQQQLMWLVPYVSPQSYYNNMQMRDNGYNSPDDDYSQESRNSPRDQFMNRQYNGYNNNYNNDPYIDMFNNRPMPTYERPGLLRTIYGVDDVHSEIAPSNVVKFLPTALPVGGERNTESGRDITSSKDDLHSQDWQDRQQRPGSYRFFGFNFLPTRTITSYWFNSTIIFKRVTLGENNLLNSQLKCLPEGFTV